jgi:uncharacterized protein
VKKVYTRILGYALVAIFLLSTVIYTVWDDNRVVQVNQEVKIANLPDSFVNYKILILSDLHGKKFGDHQQILLQVINKSKFDAVFIAGDMQARDKTVFSPLLDIVDALPKGIPIFYVGGNWGPFDSDLKTGDLLSAGEILKAHGVLLVNQPIKIERGENHIWFVPRFSFSLNQQLQKLSKTRMTNSHDPQVISYYSKILEFQSSLSNLVKNIPDEDVIIGLTHIPLTKKSLDLLKDFPPYDLILAAHYHGGQIRLPFIGAIYVPDKNSKTGGFFPDNRLVSGLYIGKSTQQFISRGLGSSDKIPFLNFRLFNTPEINVITLIK